MSLPGAIPTRAVNGFSFIREIDFFEYKRRLPSFVGEADYEAPTEENSATRIPRVVGFIDEIAEAQEILTSWFTNSILITGEEGVGKSALLLGMLNKIATGDVAPALLSKAYFPFNIHEFDKLANKDQVGLFDQAMDHMGRKDSLLIIDRLDDLFANCGPDRSRRLMGSLINTIQSMKLTAIVTAQSGNCGMIEQTSTLFVRVFKELRVAERDASAARAILRQMTPRFERRHRVVIGDDAVTEVVRLDQRWEGRLKGRSPNRLIEFMDQLSASVNVAKYGKPVELLQQEMQLIELQAEEDLLGDSVKPSAKKINAVRDQITALRDTMGPGLRAWTEKFATIRKNRQDLLEASNMLAPYQDRFEHYQAMKGKELPDGQAAPDPLSQDEMNQRDKWMRVERQLREQLAAKEQQLYAEAPHVTVADVQARFSKIAGVSAKAASTNDADRLLRIEDELGRTVFGQDAAKRSLANIYRTRAVGTSDPTRPAGVVFCTGAPGCGKTEMVEALARYDGTPIITYNMSLYTEASAVSRIMGAAPGLVGFGDVMTMPDAVEKTPKCILFLDEIEKAHEDLQRTVMQVMDKGVMPNSMNIPVSFKDAIVVFASNVVSEHDFTPEERRDDKVVRERLLGTMNPKTGRSFFLKEFIGRIDSVQVFDDVTPAIAKMILGKEIRDINKGVSGRGYIVEMAPGLEDAIIGAYFDPSQGGRSIRQLSKNVLRPMITQRLLSRQAAENPEDDGELVPMVLSFVNGAISIDGVSP